MGGEGKAGQSSIQLHSAPQPACMFAHTHTHTQAYIPPPNFRVSDSYLVHASAVECLEVPGVLHVRA